jgi:hypothetical protein
MIDFFVGDGVVSNSDVVGTVVDVDGNVAPVGCNPTDVQTQSVLMNGTTSALHDTSINKQLTLDRLGKVVVISAQSIYDPRKTSCTTSTGSTPTGAKLGATENCTHVIIDRSRPISHG